jgi:8-oxo-dGTP diphosphatase
MPREYPNHPLVGVGGVIVSGERALVVRRATPPLLGEWSIPGGMLELGEKLRDGMVREILEETGLTVEAGPVLDVFDSIFPDAEGRTQYHYVLVDFLCRAISGTAAASSDVSEVRWVTAAELPALGMKQVTQDVIRKALGIAGA